MSLDIVTLKEDHLEDAAALVTDRYAHLRLEVSALPSRYADVSTIRSLFEDILGAGPGVAALSDGRLVGFLTAWLLSDFRGKPGIFSPEWANAAVADNGPHIYECMYAALAAMWVAQGYHTHLINTFTHDPQVFKTLNWLGFGMIAADGVRDLSPIAAELAVVDIRRAVPADVDGLLPLMQALRRHLAASPTFLVDEDPFGRDACVAVLKDTTQVLWVAYQKDVPVGYMWFAPASDNASTIIVDDKTTSIRGAYTQPDLRGTGIATALLHCGLMWAREAGYTRCAVDFEPMNPPAARFWLRHFVPVCYTLARCVDERASVT